MIEENVLSGILKYGYDTYVDVSTFVDEDCFIDLDRQVIFKCIKKVFEKDSKASLDYQVIYDAATNLGCEKLIEKNKPILQSLYKNKILQNNVIGFATKLLKQKIIRNAKSQVLNTIEDSLEKLTGDESIDTITSSIETPVFDFVKNLSGEPNDIRMVSGMAEYIEELGNNPRSMIGVSTGYKAYDEAIGGGWQKGDLNVIAARPKRGKALRYGSLVLTPTGPIKIENLKIGDSICTPNHTTAKVTGIYPQGIKDLYRLTMRNGDSVDCCGEHLWLVESREFKPVIKTTLELINSLKSENGNRNRWSIRNAICYFKEQQLNLNPYIMGLLLGDGSFRGKSLTYTTKDQYLLDQIKLNIDKNYNVKNRSSKNPGINYIITNGKTGGKANKYIEIIKNYGLWNTTSHTKFIPKSFIYNSLHNRMEIIRGLMDTDGSVYGKESKIEYSTTSLEMARNFKELIHSIGGTCVIRSRYTTYKNSKKFLSYRCMVKYQNPSELFKLDRKKNKCKTYIKKHNRLSIKSINKIDQGNCICITVDSNDGLFVTDNYIVTHNSSLADNISLHQSMNLGVPVLQLDTEMRKSRHQIRILANLAKIPMNNIKNGSYYNDSLLRSRVRDTIKSIEKIPFYYQNIAGMSFSEVLSFVRRWIYKYVGINDKQNAVLIYDYFKLTDDKDLNKGMSEHQLLGYRFQELSDFVIKYELSCGCFAQQNRSGVHEDTSDTIAGTDRILMYCGSLSLFQAKTPDEIALDGPEWGNRKLKVIDCRDGPGTQQNWINMALAGKINKLVELGTRADMKNGPPTQHFNVDADDPEIQF